MSGDIDSGSLIMVGICTPYLSRPLDFKNILPLVKHFVKLLRCIRYEKAKDENTILKHWAEYSALVYSK